LKGHEFIRAASAQLKTSSAILSTKLIGHPEQVPACRDESKDLQLFFAR
jgi:hypothetical protein